jgi:hypothetical protein
MIKPGKVCSQMMKANYTGETDINVVGKYFRLKFVFNGLKTSLNLYLSSLLMVNSCIEFRIDLQADKSPIVVKGPFFPRVVNPRYRIRGTNV